MRRLPEALERRDHLRLGRQLPCKLLVDGRCCRGIVRDLSARGLLVKTRDELRPGADVIVAFRLPEGPRFVLEASVPRRELVSLSLSRLTSGGVGLRIQDPPIAYLRWIKSARPNAR